MSAWVLALAILAADTPDFVRQAEHALRMNPELSGIHRGYLAYLDAHPEAAEAERRLNAFRQQEGFARTLAPFEEWLLREPEARARYMEFQHGLARYPELPTALAVLDEFRRARSLRGRIDTPAFELELNAERAAEFLRNPANLNYVPAELVPYLARLRNDDALREQLLGALETIGAATDAAPAIRDWWRRVAAFESPVAGIIQDVDDHLLAHPAAREAWRARMAALNDTNVAAWIDYWHGRIRREPQLNGVYYPYLEWLHTHPEEVLHDPSKVEAAWPPHTQPPALPPHREEPTDARELRRPERPQIGVPVAPNIEIPRRPRAPQAPAVPHVPRPEASPSRP